MLKWDHLFASEYPGPFLQVLIARRRRVWGNAILVTIAALVPVSLVTTFAARLAVPPAPPPIATRFRPRTRIA